MSDNKKPDRGGYYSPKQLDDLYKEYKDKDRQALTFLIVVAAIIAAILIAGWLLFRAMDWGLAVLTAAVVLLAIPAGVLLVVLADFLF